MYWHTKDGPDVILFLPGFIISGNENGLKTSATSFNLL